MPVMDGFEVAAQIARRPHLTGATIMMLSSWGSGGRPALPDLGVAAYLTKPVRQSILLAAILAAWPGPSPHGAHADHAPFLREAQDPQHATRPENNADDPSCMADGLAAASRSSRSPRCGRCACSWRRTIASTSS
jgi:DNA-binding response OmpR family regulator